MKGETRFEKTGMAGRITEGIAQLHHKVERALETVQQIQTWQRTLAENRHELHTLRAALHKARESKRLAVVGTTAIHLTHHLGNRFNNMFTSVQLLERRLTTSATSHDPQLVRLVRDLHDEIKRSLTLLQDLRLLSNVHTLQLQPTDVAAVANGVVHSQAHVYAERGVRVVTDFPSNLPLAQVDAEKLAQVVLNLCTNAVEAMPQGGTLTLRAYATEHQYILNVHDTGVGVPTGLKLFEPFHSTKPSGTGLGLAIVYQLMAAQHGTVTYTSTSGQGTTFTLIFPLATANNGASSP